MNSTSNFTGSLNQTYSNITGYFKLKKVNESLVAENNFLRNQLSLKPETDSLYQNTDTSFNYLSAQVISNTVDKPNNYLMLDKGSNDGIELDMAVISSQGIVGSVVGLSENFCSVMSLLHKDSKISAKIKKNDQLANIVWSELDYKIGTLNDIPTHLKLLYGDTIITSGHSLIYPEGIMIGTIESFNAQTGANFNTASIKFSTDFNALKYVYLVKNNKKEELLILKEEVENE